MSNLEEGQVEYKFSAHQFYNTLKAGVPVNRSLAMNPMFTKEERRGFAQQADYQEGLLESLFTFPE